MDDLSSYTEEMQSPQLKKVFSCITLTSKTLNKLKPGSFFQTVSDKGAFSVFKSYVNIFF